MLASFFEFVRTQLHALYHHHQVTPVHAQRWGVLVKRWQLEAARFQLLVVDHHTGIFHVKDLHDVSTTVDEDEHPAIADILPHRLIYYATQGIKALAQIYRHRVQVVIKGFMQMEHTLSLKGQQGFADGQGPIPAVNEPWCHCGIPPPITFHHRYSWMYDPQGVH